ncbi:PTS system protein [Klebsiella michiganensis]|nr:PTS system protein [Klebsiella michiganensis]
MFWLTLLPICGGIGASLALQGSILGAIVFIVLFNVVHLGLRFGLAHYAYRMGVAAIPLIKANTKKVGHAASIVGMTVIGALVATYVRLNTTLEIKAGDAVVKLQADVIDKLMPAFLPLVYTLTMYWLVRRAGVRCALLASPWFWASSVNSVTSCKAKEVRDVRYHFDGAWRICQRHGKSDEADPRRAVSLYRYRFS